MDTANTALERRLQQLEERLQRLETQAGVPNPPPSQPPADPSSQEVNPSAIAATDTAPAISPAKIVDKTPAFQAGPAPSAAKTSSSSSSSNWLAIISVICFGLAAIFIIKLSIDSGWLTPGRQIGLAALFGFTLIGGGLTLSRSDREYASYLPAAGVIVLYLTVVGAFSFYRVVSYEVALAGTLLVSGISIWLYTRIRQDFYSITAAVGAYLVPVFFRWNDLGDFQLYYLVVCSLGFASISVWANSRVFTLVSAYLSILITGALGTVVGHYALVCSVMAIHFVIFSLSTFYHTKVHQKPLSEGEAWSFFPVLLVFYAMEYYFLDLLQPGLAPWISLGFAGLLYTLYFLARQSLQAENLKSQAIILSFGSVVLFHSLYLNLLPETFKPWLFILLVLAFTFLPLPETSGQKSRLWVIPKLAVGFILFSEFFVILGQLLQTGELRWLVLGLAAMASLWTLLIFASDRIRSRRTDAPVVILLAAHVLAIVSFYQLSRDFGSLAVSGSWLVYALLVLVLAFVKKDETIAKSSVAVLSFAAAKALLYDAAAAPTVVRILCLILTGGVLYGAGLLLRKVKSWQE